MNYYIYFLHSEKWEKFYVGILNDVDDRLQMHNSGQSLSTKGGIPWKVLHIIECKDKPTAMSLETKIKKRGINRYLTDNNIFPGL